MASSCRGCAAAGDAGVADDYPEPADPRLHHRRAPAASATSSCACWASQCAADLGQPLIVENKPGGAGNIGARACADATPDGYTICIINADPLIYNQFLFKKMPFDPEKGSQPIVNLFHLIQVLVVNSNLERQDRRRAGRAVEGEARHAQLSHRLGAAGRLHGAAQEGARRRLGARAVPRRRRGGRPRSWPAPRRSA